MLYRFKSAQNPHLSYTTKWWMFQRFGGSFIEGCLICDVPSPKKHIPERSRFYFTEAGYKRNVNLIVAEAKEHGQVLQVVRIKEPNRSRVVYRDHWQVALLPPNKRRKS